MRDTPYIGSGTWALLRYSPGEPIAHKHHCPNCYETPWCSYPNCALEPDLELDDGTPCGAHICCSPQCQKEQDLEERAYLVEAYSEEELDEMVHDEEERKRWGTCGPPWL